VLKSLDIVNFRSIRGHIHAPLDAKVVLVHGENGAGKTSLLSAIELALTGGVQSLQRADPGYEKQLLHRSASEGSVLLRALAATSERSFRAHLKEEGAQSGDALDEQLAAFFRERSFLPQSLLGQLLQIYQDAGSDSASPLARFVGKLLGLDRLDALEAGLKPLVDVRNVRKIVDGWLTAENEKSRLDRLLADQRKTRDALNERIQSTLSELATLCTSLEFPVKVQEESLDEVALALGDARDSDAFAQLADQQRRLASIRREIADARSATGMDAPIPAMRSDEASRNFARWQAEHSARVSAVRNRVEGVLPDLSMLSEPSQFAEEALKRLRTEQRQQADRATQARADIRRHAMALDERNVAVRQRDMIDDEVSRLSSSARGVSVAPCRNRFR
jgi:exonuclease SbcC